MVSSVEVRGEFPQVAGVEFRTIARFPGYAFGSDGSVWSAWQRQPGIPGYRGAPKWKIEPRWTRMNPSRDIAGYPIVNVRTADGGYKKSLKVCRLTLEAFRGPPEPGQITRHFPDPSPANGRIDNLQWGTYSDNNGSDRHAQGTAYIGEANNKAKLTADQVREIRKLLAAGESQKDLANRFGVDPYAIYAIRIRKTWAWLDAPGGVS